MFLYKSTSINFFKKIKQFLSLWSTGGEVACFPIEATAT